MSELSEAGRRSMERRADQSRIRNLTETLERTAEHRHYILDHAGEFRGCTDGNCLEVRAILVTGAI